MTDFVADGLEIKATAGPADGDMRAMFAEFMGAFETFKETMTAGWRNWSDAGRRMC